MSKLKIKTGTEVSSSLKNIDHKDVRFLIPAKY